GRRILADYTGNIQHNRDEESLKLLKKIADIEIKDYPSHFLEQIRSTWKNWHSPPRLSPDSLHLDEIEEMNLNNMQEEEPDVIAQSRCNQQSLQRGLVMTKAMMEATIRATQRHPDADKEVLQHGFTITSMMGQVCATWNQP
ncbi:hypothetical protein Goari_005453, partial [Gossypium aridum]|nr:hypothetical protein [Gossypium aridum]